MTLTRRGVGRPRRDAGSHHTGSTSYRILALLDAMWGEWIDLDRIVGEYLDRFDGEEETVRRKFYQILRNPPPYLRVRFVASKATTRPTPYRQVFVDNPYLREENHVA